MINIKILALDQALNLTGWCVMDGEQIEYGKLNLTKLESSELDTKVSKVKEFLNETINTYEIELVILEDVQQQVNAQTFKKLSYLQGVLRNYLYENKIPFSVLSPSQWRSELKIKGGKRAILKKNTQKYIYDNFGFNATQDEADAIAIGLAGVKKLKRNKLEIIKEINNEEN